MTVSAWIRQSHRWLAIAFTIGFLVNIFATVTGTEPPVWVYFLALIPLFLLLPTGLWMLALPWFQKARGPEPKAAE
ncbi:hypothetical protein FKB34_04345 [Glycocaulis profundi]|nr:hypothetical protein FKB34_04345 [Glycocaulis profundi]